MNIRIPHDFSGEVPNRKCEGAFPEWKVERKEGFLFLTGPLAGTNLEATSDDSRCEECLLQEVCTRYVVDTFLGNPLPPKKDFNIVSNEVYRDKILQAPASDITALRECNGDYPWDKWEEWNVEGTDGFEVGDPCISCIFHISCAVQALRKIDSSYGEPRNKEDFDEFSRKRTLEYVQTGR